MPVITHAIDIHAPKDVVEKQYTDWESYPNYIDELEEVEMKSPHDMHCRLKVAGINFSYDAHVENKGEGTYTWHTTGGDIAHSGQTQIESLGPEKTRLHMTVDYKAPGPEIASKIAEWFNLAENKLHNALDKFRQNAEARAT